MYTYILTIHVMHTFVLVQDLRSKSVKQIVEDVCHDRLQELKDLYEKVGGTVGTSKTFREKKLLAKEILSFVQ